MIHFKRFARVLLPIVSVLLGLAALDQNAATNAGFTSAAILSFVAAFWWHAIGPQTSED